MGICNHCLVSLHRSSSSLSTAPNKWWLFGQALASRKFKRKACTKTWAVGEFLELKATSAFQHLQKRLLVSCHERKARSQFLHLEEQNGVFLRVFFVCVLLCSFVFVWGIF